MRYVYLTIGFIFVGLGFIGVWLPVMPTVPFLIVAAWCFSRSSPRFSRWLYNQPLFGPMLCDWNERGAIHPKAKLLAAISMVFGFSMFYFLVKPDLLWLIIVAAFFIASAAFVLSRPSR